MARRDRSAVAPEKGQPAKRAREAEYAHRWRAGVWVGRTLTTLTGERYTLLYQGRPGTGTGPDFRDAVLSTSAGERLCGDVELHLRARNWTAHGHHQDARYNGVALHVVIARGSADERATRRQDGEFAPITVLPEEDDAPRGGPLWPCRSLGAAPSRGALFVVLRSLGEARLHERAATMSAALAQSPAPPVSVYHWSRGDALLWLALAEGLGYGRDREAMRAAGWQMLISTVEGAPHPARSGEEQRHTPRLDSRRLDGLGRCLERWRAEGPWSELEAVARLGDEDDAAERLVRALVSASGGAISAGRAAIVTVNVVLPFALAMAEQLEDEALARRALAIYVRVRGLPSNTITRLLGRQFGLERLPSGAQAQQGFHHVWAHWCREKRCESCPLASLRGGITIAATAGF